MLLELEKPPYAEYSALLNALRESPEARSRVACREAKDPEKGTFDANWSDRARLAWMLRLHTGPSDLELTRFLLDEEIKARRADSFQGAGDVLRILSAILVDFGNPEDLARFWAAKRANFDTFAGGYDIEFLFSLSDPEALRSRLGALASEADVSEFLGNYDIPAIVQGLDDWRESMRKWYPNSVDGLGAELCEVLADMFDDLLGVERLGLAASEHPADRARVFRRVGKHADAVEQWRLAADNA